MIIFIGVIFLARTIVAIFELFDNAQRAAYEVKDKGLRTDNISLIVKDGGNKAYYSSNNENGHMKLVVNGSNPFTLSRGQRISDGIITGGIFGGIIGIIIGALSMFLRNLGFVAAIGPISGLIFGFIFGGIIGGLIDAKIPKKKRQMYEELVSKGNTLFSMKIDEDRMEPIVQIIKDNGALSIEKY
jgi:hypothetical protein